MAFEGLGAVHRPPHSVDDLTVSPPAYGPWRTLRSLAARTGGKPVHARPARGRTQLANLGHGPVAGMDRHGISVRPFLVGVVGCGRDGGWRDLQDGQAALGASPRCPLKPITRLQPQQGHAHRGQDRYAALADVGVLGP